MTVLLSETAQKDVRGSHAPGALTLVHVVSLLERLNPHDLTSATKVHRVSGTEEEIYVLRERGLRVFFTRRDKDIVILSITNG